MLRGFVVRDFLNKKWMQNCTDIDAKIDPKWRPNPSEMTQKSVKMGSGGSWRGSGSQIATWVVPGARPAGKNGRKSDILGETGAAEGGF